jgi:rod shape-determining protein MreB
MLGHGVVLYEPSIVAFSNDVKQKKIKAVGLQAIQMVGKSPVDTAVVNPISEGLIIDEDACVRMLKVFLKKLTPKELIFNPKFKAILCVPMGLSSIERRCFESVCLKAGISEISLIESALASAIGLDLPVTNANCNLVVNCGGGKTDIAVVSMCKIVEGCSLNIGGNMLDLAIIDFILGKYNVRVGKQSAKKIKHDIVSLYQNDSSQTQILGADIKERTPVEATVNAEDLLDCIMPYFDKIVEGIKIVLSKCNPEVVADIKLVGLNLCGGLSQLPGIDEMLKKNLGLNINQVDNPSFVSISGAGKLIADKKLLKDIIE